MKLVSGAYRWSRRTGTRQRLLRFHLVIADQLIDQPRRQELRYPLPRQRYYFRHVGPHDLPLRHHQAQQPADLVPLQPARLGGVHAGGVGRVETVNVDRPVNSFASP